MSRSAIEVFENHLQLRLVGKVEEDIEKNYSPSVVLISSVRTFHGKDGVRASAAQLERDIGEAEFEYVRKVVEGEFAYLLWKARSPTVTVENGVDSFLIRDGQIQAQSIFYEVKRK